MAFRSQLTIRFGDIDHAGIVYYPRFLHYFHVALEEFFEGELGVAYHRVIDTHRIGLPTVHLETDFSRPFNHGDHIEVEVCVLNVGRTSISFGYRVYKKGEGEPRITGHNVVVCLDMEKFRKQEIPAWLRELLVQRIGLEERT
jgi:4-hydroxybenzoyl-CoA thioesterase